MSVGDGLYHLGEVAIIIFILAIVLGNPFSKGE